MIDPVEVWILYFSCGCVRWRTSLSVDGEVRCEHSDAYIHAKERRWADHG